MERRYLPYCDNGHDYPEIIFYSAHRAGSKANEEDARREMQRKWGRKKARAVTILTITRYQ